jgi:glycosyltransferase involved in cell wall biosynthesis
MSCIYKGVVEESELSGKSKGGTEMMRARLMDGVDPALLQEYAIHLSRPRDMKGDVKNILWCHDLAEDPENKILKEKGWNNFDHIVFVSQWQRDQYITYYGIPHSMCSVIPNAIEKDYKPSEEKDYETIRFVYHTTPHRGLELLIPIFEQLAKEFDNIHLDVFSSFGIYGWGHRDEPYQPLFDKIEAHPKMTYHGSVNNRLVLDTLDKSHIFLYPNTWKETSCISLIEAIKSGLVCIHPNLGALTETASGATISYDFHENATQHANVAYSVAKGVLNMQQSDPDFIRRFTTSDRFNLARNNINTFTTTWTQLLRALAVND